jgi:hypothetical protein
MSAASRWHDAPPVQRDNQMDGRSEYGMCRHSLVERPLRAGALAGGLGSRGTGAGRQVQMTG